MQAAHVAGTRRAHVQPQAGRITTRKEDRMTDRSDEHGRRRALGGGSGVRFTRRTWLKGAATAAVTATGPFSWTRRTGAAGKVVIRTIGGAYEEANVKAIFEPFTKATGIEVVKVPATLGKLPAMFQAGGNGVGHAPAREPRMISLIPKGAADQHCC